MPTAPPADARDLLASIRFLRDLDAETLSDVAQAIEWLMLPGGETLFRQGGRSEGLFVVASGRLRVVLESEGGSAEVLAEVARGGHVGELSLLTGSPHSATVVALRDTELGRLGREDFERLLERHPRAMLGLVHTLAAWLEQRHRRHASSRPATIAVLPLLSDDPSFARAFALELERAFAAGGTTLRLSPEELERRMGSGAHAVPENDTRHGTITRWLNEQELQYRYVLYDASEGPPPWTQRCLRQADRVLVVARAGRVARQRRTLVGVHQPLAGSERGRLELVLVHPAGTALPRDTSGPLAMHPFVAHYHVREGVAADIHRVVRHVSGDAVGLVLSGGGARAFAHIGVAMALEEAGIPIDRVGGVSVGSVMAGQLALGHPASRLAELNRGRWRMDYTVPLLALLAGRRAAEATYAWFGDQQIEDLWLPFFCVSVSLTSSRLMVHRDGSLQQAVLASTAIPGVLPPIASNGQLLVDGALLNNLPVDVMRSLGSGPVIAIDCSSAVDASLRPAADGLPSRWRLLLNLFRRSGQGPAPNILRILQRSTLVPSAGLSKRLRAESDLYIAPPVGGFDFFDFKALDRIVEHSYRYAVEHLPEWKAQLRSGAPPEDDGATP